MAFSGGTSVSHFLWFSSSACYARVPLGIYGTSLYGLNALPVTQVQFQPMIALAGRVHLLRCFEYQLSDECVLAHFGHLMWPRSLACVMNWWQASLKSLVMNGRCLSLLAKLQALRMSSSMSDIRQQWWPRKLMFTLDNITFWTMRSLCHKTCPVQPSLQSHALGQCLAEWVSWSDSVIWHIRCCHFDRRQLVWSTFSL